jgi:putative tryptophan/tyrosine transport system substrate-binding protein
MAFGIGRREFISAIGGAAVMWPLAARAQQVDRIPRVGVLWHAGSAEQEQPYFGALLEGFKDLGYVEGKNIRLEHRFPNETPERFKSMAAELVSLKVDVLVTVGNPTAPYAKDSTSTIPIVFVFVSDPVGAKLVDSLARPGGNATGLSNFATDLIAKRIELLKEIVPGLSHVGLLVNPGEPSSRQYVGEGKAAAAALALAVQIFEAHSLDELEPAFDAMVKGGVQAVTFGPGGLLFQGRAVIDRLATARHLPTCVWSRETVESGALASYGPDQVAMARHVAVYVDKILKGAKPAELPVEQPTKFQLLINLKTAKALDLTIPESFLVRADEVIE